MVKKYSAGGFAPAGTYWNRKTWELVQVSEGGGNLQAEEGVTFYRVPLLLVLTLGPLAGLAFILFLPLAVPLVALYTIFKVVASIIPWRPRRQAGKHLHPSR
jgi:hypothetical protein